MHERIESDIIGDRLIRFDLQLFAGSEEGAGNEGDDKGGKSAEDRKDDKDKKNDAGGGGKRETDDGPSYEESELAKMTQAELVKSVQDIRRREARYRTRAQTAEKENGEIKGRLEADDRRKLEEEKRFEEIAAKERKERERSDRERDEARSELTRFKVVTVVREQAKAQGLKNLRILDKEDLSGIKVDKDGSVDDRDVIRLVRDLRNDYPELFETVDDKKNADDKRNGDRRSSTDDAQDRGLGRDTDRERQRESEKRRGYQQPARDEKGGRLDWSTLTPDQLAAEEKRLGIGGATRF